MKEVKLTDREMAEIHVRYNEVHDDLSDKAYTEEHLEEIRTLRKQMNDMPEWDEEQEDRIYELWQEIKKERK